MNRSFPFAPSPQPSTAAEPVLAVALRSSTSGRRRVPGPLRLDAAMLGLRLLASGLLAGAAVPGWAIGEIARVSLAADGTQGNGGSGAPTISADGRFVAFESLASNLVPNDTNNAVDVFVAPNTLAPLPSTLLTLSPGADTSSASPLRPGKRLLIPTSGPTATFPTGFPAAGVGRRTATFTVAVTTPGIGTHSLVWSIESATDLAGSPVPLAQVGSLLPTVAPSAEFTPAEATLRRADRIALVFKACQDDQPANCARFDNVELSPMGDLDFDGKVSNTDYVKAARWAQGRLLPVVPIGGIAVNLAGEIGDPFLRLLSDVRPAVGQLLSPSRFDGWTPEFGQPGNTVGAPGYVPSPVKADFDGNAFPFGDGLLSNPDAIWIFRKAQANASGKTLDPRIGGVTPIDF